MSIPYYSEITLTCEQCDGEIYKGYEYLEHEGNNFCQDSCLTDWFLDNGDIRYYFLTDKKVYD